MINTQKDITKIKTLYSKVIYFNGFSQRELRALLSGNSSKQFSHKALITSVMNNIIDNQIFFHNKNKTILLKKPRTKMK